MAAEMCVLPDPGGPNSSRCTLLQPGVAGGQGVHAGPAQHGHVGKIEAVERLVRRQPGFGEVALDASLGAFGDLDLGQGGQEARGGPAFAVGPLGNLWPEPADGGQTQIAQQQRQPGGVVLDPRHDGTPTIMMSGMSGASSAS